MAPDRRRATRVLLAAAALVGIAWWVSPVASPPLYDSLGQPAEPYRYLNPPPGNSHGEPSAAKQDAMVSGGAINATFISTTEQPPQVQVLIGDNAVAVPAGATKVTISITAVPPPLPIPAALGMLDGNVYQVSVTPDVAGPLTLKPGATSPTVVLRGPPGSSSAQILRLQDVSGAWEKLHTVPLGSAQDMVAASTSAFGWFTLVLPKGAADGGGGGGGSGTFPVVAVVVPAVLLALIATLLAMRLSRRR